MPDAVTEETVESNIYIEGDEWRFTDLEVRRSRYNLVDTVHMIGIPHPDNPGAEPDFGDQFLAYLGSESQTFDGRQGSELQLVYTGEVTNFERRGDYRWEIRASNNILNIKTGEVTLQPSGERRIAFLINEVLDQSGVPPHQRDINLITPQEGELVVPPGQWSGLNLRTYMQAGLDSGDSLLEKLTARADVAWWVDKDNWVNVGIPEVTNRELEYVVDTSAGKLSPPYLSVEVVGDEPTTSLVAAEPVRSTYSLDPTNDYEIYKPSEDDRDPAEPRFTYTSREVQTQAEADNVAKKMIKKLQEQSRGGWIEVIGRPDIEILDVVTLPVQLGGESYSVSEIIHRANGNDGYITRIKCGGLANPDDYAPQDVSWLNNVVGGLEDSDL